MQVKWSENIFKILDEIHVVIDPGGQTEWKYVYSKYHK
jgi:hypothetical protein